ncbi:MAG: zinc-dependent metalloprotease [Symploca sp. SIO2B6]|nr:zinc-dependent metalloprotease [Symploca sp. SIO2B6]
MRKLPLWVLFLLGLCLWIGAFGVKHVWSLQIGQVVTLPANIHQLSEFQLSQAEGEDKNTQESQLKPFEDVVKDTEKLEGLFTLYRNQDKGKIYLELKPEQLDRNYLDIVTLSTGIGQGFLVRGMPLNYLMFRWHRVQDKLQFIVPNVNFRALPGSPLQRSIDQSFSDSVLYSIPIKSIHPDRKTLLIDLEDLLLTPNDLPGLTQALPFLLGASYFLDTNSSYFSNTKAFASNVEIELVYSFASGGDTVNLPSLPDSRAFNLSVNYSLSELPTNSTYVPRLADNRLGYFVTAYKDFSEDSRLEPFVRYIERWNLEPKDPEAALSPPKQPIVFWIENTVPLEYRDAVREGILIWNKAFEKAGFQDAVQVEQMPDDADWDPADVRYNTIRWSSSFESPFLGIGPSRVNPLTGQILDADIIIDANVVRLIKGQYRDLLEPNQLGLSSYSPLTSFCNDELVNHNNWELKENNNHQSISNSSIPPLLSQLVEKHDLCFGTAASQQLSLGAMAISLLHNGTPNGVEMQKYVHQFLVSLIGHEVGHTLGLRHNFHGSTMLMPQELNNTSITHTKGLVGSIMDYVGVNLAPVGIEQGDYFPVVVGPYDIWAIEYGYKPSGAISPQAERRFLEKIAQKAPEAELAYGTDEDVFGFLDPDVNPFDLSGDVLLYTQWQMDNARQMWNRLNKRYPVRGDSYSEMRVKFNTVFIYYFRQALLLSNYIGGQSFNRDLPSDPNGRPPFEPVSLEKQRQALTQIQKYVFAEDAFNFPPKLLNKLAPSRWNHWGNPAPRFSLDYPIHDNILSLQRIVLRRLLSNSRLTRLRDLELKAGQEQGQALTLPELFDTLQTGIWKEILTPTSKPITISSIRRSLQREHLEIMTSMLLRRVDVPEDARTLAWYQLRQLGGTLNKILKKRNEQLDIYTRAHLEETRDRIFKTLDAQVQSS